MPGRHAAPGLGPFFRELIVFVAKIALVAAVVAVAIVLLVNYLPRAGDDDQLVPLTVVTASPTTRGAAATTLATATTRSAPTTTAPSPTTTAPSPTTTAPSPTTTTEAGPRDPSEVEVLVLNSTTRDFLAAAVSEDLAALGYVVLEPDNYRPTLATSRVWYAPGFAAEAFELGAQVPDAQIEANPADDPAADIVVVLGTSFQG